MTILQEVVTVAVFVRASLEHLVSRVVRGMARIPGFSPSLSLVYEPGQHTYSFFCLSFSSVKWGEKSTSTWRELKQRKHVWWLELCLARGKHSLNVRCQCSLFC